MHINFCRFILSFNRQPSFSALIANLCIFLMFLPSLLTGDEGSTIDKPDSDTSSTHGQLTDGIQERLLSLLDMLVDSTKSASIEMLERYYSALQCCIHKQRHHHNKTQLLQVGGV